MKHENLIVSAHFSPDGQQVLTGSADKTAQLWDVANSKKIGEPMKHEGAIYSAQFSPDGQRIVTASADKTAQLRDAAIMTDQDTTEDILILAELAEATAGVNPERTMALPEKSGARLLGPPSNLTALQRFMKWSVSDHRNRTISPFLQVTVSDWLENRIKEGSVEDLRVALQIDPGNARITAHLGRRLADLAAPASKQGILLQTMQQLSAATKRLAGGALDPGSDPDEIPRARGEADFLTSRAVKLAPDNDEVKKLRDEVVQVLKLKPH